MVKSIKNYLSLVTFAHTIFAMPFAFIGFALGLKAMNFETYKPWWELLILVLLCMVFARSAAMAFNRWLDADFDAINPRTAVREIPAGIISKRNAMIFVVGSCIAFIVTTYFINALCLVLAPVALFVILVLQLYKKIYFAMPSRAGAGFEPFAYWRLYCSYRKICFRAGLIFIVGFVLG